MGGAPTQSRAPCPGGRRPGQLVAMLFCQLGHAQSLREICGGLAASEGKLKHLGLPAAPARSTLGYANVNTDPGRRYQTVFQQLLEKCQQVVAIAHPEKRSGSSVSKTGS